MSDLELLIITIFVFFDNVQFNTIHVHTPQSIKQSFLFLFTTHFSQSAIVINLRHLKSQFSFFGFGLM